MKRRIPSRWLVVGIVLTGLSFLWACGPTPEDITELRNQQKQILAKLGEIEKKIDTVAARPAAPQPAQQKPRGPDPSTVHEIPLGASIPKGPKDAPVTITAFSDYQCPFCARVEPLIADVLKEYPTQVRFVHKHFPLSFHKEAMPAALAVVAAGKQNKLWEMHDKVFANPKALKDENLKKYAQEIGLDVEKFDADRKSPEVQKIVQDDMALARKVGVRGTPTLFVNGKLLQNRSLDGFKQLIDPILAKKG